MMKEVVLVVCALCLSNIIVGQEIPSKPKEFEPAFEVGDTSEVVNGEMHTVIKSDEQWLLMDGYDIQAYNSVDSLYDTSELYIQDLGGDLSLGNAKSGVRIYGLVRLDTLNFGPSGGIQTRASSEIAFGNITKGLLPAPVISSGTGNYTVTWNAVDSRYEVEFDDYDYSLNGYTTIVTPRGTDIHRWRANGDKTSDTLHIYLYNNLGVSIRSSFQFVTYYFDEGESDEVILLKGNEEKRKNSKIR